MHNTPTKPFILIREDPGKRANAVNIQNLGNLQKIRNQLYHEIKKAHSLQCVQYMTNKCM